MRTLLILATILIPTAAQAQARFEVSTGIYTSDALQRKDTGEIEGSGGVSLGAMLTGETAGVDVGVVGDLGGSMFGGSDSHLGVVAGSTLTKGHLHLRVFGEVGYALITGIGDGLFSDGHFGDTEATLPYAGGRIGLAHGLFSGKWTLGVAMVFRHHLERTENDVAVQTCLFGCDTEMRSYEVGGNYLGFNVTLAVR